MEDSKFAPKELEPKRQLDGLMREWKEEISMFEKDANRNGELSAKIESVRKKYNVENLSELFVRDGFYPHYYDQKYRILFIGWQSHGLNGSDHIGDVYDQITDKYIGERPLNAHRTQALLLYITYSILNNYTECKDLPWATKIADTFAADGGISYAFMNLSKFSSKATEGTHTDKELMGVCLEIGDQLSKDFFAEEVKILNPDLIIGLDVIDDYEDSMGNFLPVGNKGDDELLKTGMLRTSLGEYPFINFKRFFDIKIGWYDRCFSKIREAAKAILSNNK